MKFIIYRYRDIQNENGEDDNKVNKMENKMEKKKKKFFSLSLLFSHFPLG